VSCNPPAKAQREGGGDCEKRVGWENPWVQEPKKGRAISKEERWDKDGEECGVGDRKENLLSRSTLKKDGTQQLQPKVLKQ